METSSNIFLNKPFYALIVAGGTGERFGGDTPKQYVKINGKAVLRHTLEAFMGCPGLQGIRVVIHKDHGAYYEDAVLGLDMPPPLLGGEGRINSVYNGLLSFSHIKNEDIILIHDAARPLVKSQDIMAVIQALSTAQVASLAVPVADTLRQEADGQTIDRSGLWAMQTPQGFHYGVIKAAHESCGDKVYTDDAGLVSAQGVHVKLVPGRKTNIKITTPDDLNFARAMLERTETRTGMGFDVHAFDAAKPGSVRLCGIDVPHHAALAGHSDADVGLHALTDAILGAIAQGDIGRHFPPSDMAFKNMDSAVFLRHAVGLVSNIGGAIVNLDLTLICEAPKITPHAPAMIMRVAEICGINPQRVSIKATTTERLGFTGRGEGIAAQAVANIRLPWGMV